MTLACQNCPFLVPSVPKVWGTPQEGKGTFPICFQLPMLTL